MGLVYSAYQSFQSIMSKIGLDIAIKKTIKNNHNHESIFPYASYAPWKSDVEFQKIYKIIKEYTLVDKYRCYELWQLLEETKDVSGDVIEIGVRRGGTGALLAKKSLLLHTKAKVYLCDTFAGVVKASDKDSSYDGGEHSDTSLAIVKDLCQKSDLHNVELLTGIFPEDTAHLIPSNNKFRLCHIDVDVYQSAKDILDRVWDKIEVGGLVVFDDYGFITCNGITTLVNEYRTHQDRVIIHNLNGHAIMIKLS